VGGVGGERVGLMSFLPLENKRKGSPGHNIRDLPWHRRTYRRKKKRPGDIKPPLHARTDANLHGGVNPPKKMTRLLRCTKENLSTAKTEKKETIRIRRHYDR